MARCTTRCAWQLSSQPQRAPAHAPGPKAAQEKAAISSATTTVCAGGNMTISTRGNDISTDEAGAMTFFRKAAERGHADAQRSYGHMLQYGRGCEKDEKAAVEWYKKAAQQENADGQFALGFCYAHGKGVPKDDKEAVMLFRKAAEKGHADATRSLATMYKYGRGVQRDPEEAEQLFLRASQGLKTNAQRSLGFMMAHAPRYTGGALGSSDYKATLVPTKKHDLSDSRRHATDPPH
mmetsp:Transcript_14732/g.32688  ORF Transcript_14732/g.32688 Transcript_14732/m.32688 type:complete len:236 (-) Transcript_14732:235-942(-)